MLIPPLLNSHFALCYYWNILDELCFYHSAHKIYSQNRRQSIPFKSYLCHHLFNPLQWFFHSNYFCHNCYVSHEVDLGNSFLLILLHCKSSYSIPITLGLFRHFHAHLCMGICTSRLFYCEKYCLFCHFLQVITQMSCCSIYVLFFLPPATENMACFHQLHCFRHSSYHPVLNFMFLRIIVSLLLNRIYINSMKV